jgi:hypothetical protein
MKIRYAFSLLLLTSLVSTAASAGPGACSNQTLKGTYAFTIHGQIFPPDNAPPLVVDGIAKTTFDGNGNLKQVDAVAVNGDLAVVWRQGTGTYSLNSDCTGTMTLDNASQPILHLAILVSHGGDLIHTVVTNPGFAVTSDAERVVLRDDD